MSVRSIRSERARQAQRGSAGYTLVEMLAALAVLSIMAVMVSTGISAGVRAYERAQFSSQADMLSATVNSALSDAFRFMRPGTGDNLVVTHDGKDVSFAQGTTVLQIDDGRFHLVGGDTDVKLVNDGIYGVCQAATVSKEYCSMDEGVRFYYTFSNGGSLTSPTYTFTATPQKNVSRDVSASSGSGTPSGGDEGDEGGETEKGALNDEITEVEDVIGASSGESAERAALETALKAAQSVSDDDGATQKEIDQAAADLAAALAAYKKIQPPDVGLDLSAVQSAIDAADAEKTWVDPNATSAGLKSAYEVAENALKGIGVTTQEEVDAAAAALKKALEDYLSTRPGLALDGIDKAIAAADAVKPWESDDATAVSNLQDAYNAAKSARSSATKQEDLDNAADALNAALKAYKKSLSGGGSSDIVFKFEVGGKTYTVPVVEYDGSGDFEANTVYLYNDVFYYSDKGFNDGSNKDIATVSGWAYSYGGITVVSANYVTAADFTNGNQCPTTIKKGTMYYDEENNKLWTAHQDQAWLTRPDIDSSGWDDVSGMLG